MGQLFKHLKYIKFNTSPYITYHNKLKIYI